MTVRCEPLILVASADPDLVGSVVASLAAAGYCTAVARSAEGCLRVATASGPDLILMDERLSGRGDHLLRAHPISSRARLLRLEPRALKALCTAAAAGLERGVTPPAPTPIAA
jgi:CheY-like chemotaxis protein